MACDDVPPHDDDDAPADLVPRLSDDARKAAQAARKAAARQAARRRRHDEVIAAALARGQTILELGSDSEIAQVLQDSYERQADGVPIVHGHGRAWRWDLDDRLWRPLDAPMVASHVRGLDGTPIAPPDEDEREPQILRVSERLCKAVHKLLTLAAEHRYPGWFDARVPGVAVGADWVHVEQRNGSWRVVRRPRSFDDRATWAIEGDVVLDAEPDLWLQTLGEWWGDEADGDERAALLQEIFGAALLGLGPRFQRALFLVGQAGSGKSVACAVLAGLFPDAARASISPQDCAREGARYDLSLAAINIAPEVPSREILDSDAWKAVITGDPVRARQLYHDGFSARLTALHVYACNELPSVADNSRGFWRRVAMLDFPRSFDTASPDRHRAERILATERAALVGWALRGAVRLLEQGTYTEPASSREAFAEWQETSNAIQAWVAQRCERVHVEDTHAWTSPDVLYGAFKAWCSDEGHVAGSSTVFGRRLKTLLPRGYVTRRRDGMRYGLRVKGRV